MSAPLTQEMIESVTSLVRGSAAVSLEWFRQPSLISETENKAASGYDPVTIADRAVEDVLRDGLSSLFPADAIVGEERGTSGSGSRRWIIDPIDGTRAFVTGQPMWGVLVGLYEGDVPIAGWSYLPVLDEMYVAAGGAAHMTARGGATRPMATSAVTSLAAATMACTHPSMFAPGPELDRFWAVERECKLSRFGGDCMNWLLLADGTIDLVIENELHSYDIGSIIPTVEAAGGVIERLDGGPAIGAGYVVGAATPELHQTAMAMLRS